MIMTYIDDETDILNFVQVASEHFSTHHKHTTFTLEDITPGCLMALRYGGGNDCIVVFRLSDKYEVINFQQCIKQQKRN